MNNSMNNRVSLDKVVLCFVGLVLLYSLILLLHAFFNGVDIGNWIWDRHQNQFSWYSRPLFIIPACYYAYHRKIWHVISFMLLLATSLFWFPAPLQVSPKVIAYLEWEKQLFFTNDSFVPLFLLSSVVVLFLFCLFYSFWHRNPWLGLILINVGTILKVIVSIVLGKDLGMAAIVPSLSSMAIINVVAFLVWKFIRK